MVLMAIFTCGTWNNVQPYNLVVTSLLTQCIPFFWSAINWKLWYKSSIRLYYGDVSEWVKNSRMGRKTPNNQTNLEFIQWIKVIRFLFPHCELSRVLFPVWKEQTIKAPGTSELKTQLSPLGKRDWPKQSFVLCFNNICHVVQ